MPQIEGPSPSAFMTPEQSQAIAIESMLAYGALWDVFTISSDTELPISPNPNTYINGRKAQPRQIVKICCPSALGDGTPRSGGYTSSDARHAIHTEVEYYFAELMELQGDVVPRVYGVYGGVTLDGREVWAMVMEHVGTALVIGDDAAFRAGSLGWDDKYVLGSLYDIQGRAE